MDIFTLYVGQGALAAVCAGNEAVIVDAHMPDCDDITQPQIEQSLDRYLSRLAWLGFTTTYKTAGTAKLRGSHTRRRFLWVGLWVGKVEL
jgi:hypothetical protein